MIVSSNCEREAALDSFARPSGTFQSATGKHGFLSIVEGDGAEFFPVADQLILDDNLMNCELPLLFV